MSLGGVPPMVVTDGLTLPAYTSRTIGTSVQHYLVEGYLRPAVTTVLFAVVLYAVARAVEWANFLSFVGGVLVAALLFALAVLLVCFSPGERRSYLRAFLTVFRNRVK